MDVYAAWEPEETSYYASIWLQNAEDVNVYEYSEAVELRGLSGTETTIPEDLEERYPGFEVVVDTSEVKTISGIGDTHINVYLKRKTYNINIYVENPKNSRQYYYAFYSSLRYGQDTSYVYDYLKTYNNGIYRNYLWFDGPTSGTYFTHPPKMPSNDINIYGRDQGANSYQYTLYFKEYDPDKSMLAMNDVSDPFVFKNEEYRVWINERCSRYIRFCSHYALNQSPYWTQYPGYYYNQYAGDYYTRRCKVLFIINTIVIQLLGHPNDGVTNPFLDPILYDN